MSNQFQWLMLIFLLATLSGCDRPIEFEMPLSEDIELEVRHEGKMPSRCTLEAESSSITRIADWLQDNQGGWERSVVSFVPGVMIRGRDFTLNFLGDGVILNFERGQFTHSIDATVYSHLKCEEPSAAIG